MIKYIEVTETSGRNVLYLLDHDGFAIGSMDYLNVYTSGNDIHFVNGETKFTFAKNGVNRLETPFAVIDHSHSEQAYQQAWALVLTMGKTIR